MSPKLVFFSLLYKSTDSK